jgi:hypothetical protein
LSIPASSHNIGKMSLISFQGVCGLIQLIQQSNPVQSPSYIDRAANSSANTVEVSIVMPCLNEAETIAICIKKAQWFITEHHLAGEVIIADNGSKGGSQAIGSLRSPIKDMATHCGVVLPQREARTSSWGMPTTATISHSLLRSFKN